MKLLVTGGAGYVGSQTVRHLIAAGHEVVVFDNLSLGHRHAVGSARLVVGSICDTDALDAVFRDHAFDAVLHFAALTLVDESCRNPRRYYENNVVGTLRLVDAMRANNVGNLVFSSTTAVYGTPSELPVSEDAPLAPESPYGRTKAIVEQLLRDYAAAYGLAAVCLRYFNAAGASLDGRYGEEHEPETHLIPRTLEVALGKRSELDIFGTDYPTPDGTCVRDYVHVVDLAIAHQRALDVLHPGEVQAFNLGAGRGTSVREIVDWCRRVTGREIRTVERPRRPGDPAAIVADTRRAAEKLDWRPKYSDLETIVQTAWRKCCGPPL